MNYNIRHNVAINSIIWCKVRRKGGSVVGRRSCVCCLLCCVVVLVHLKLETRTIMSESIKTGQSHVINFSEI